MRAIAWLLRVFCYLFHAVVSLALLGLGTVAILSNSNHLKLEILPWQGSQLNTWLVGLGIFGLLSVLLAMTGKIHFLLPLWSIFVVAMLVKGVFLSPAVSFDGPDDFHLWLSLLAGALAALIGSFTLLSRRRS